MSSPFSYEIDERNLRIQLKNLEITQREEAWQKFESFAQQHPIEVAPQGFSGIQLKVNRNVIVPAIFGLVIIVFATILYNFVSIDKNKESETTVKAAEPATEAVIESPAPEEQIKPAAATVPVVEENTTNKAIPTATVAEPAKKIEPEPVAVKKEIPTAKEKTSEKNSQTIANSNQDTTQPAQEQPVKKKRNRKREEETISALKPTVVSEDEAPVEIPQ